MSGRRGLVLLSCLAWFCLAAAQPAAAATGAEPAPPPAAAPPALERPAVADSARAPLPGSAGSESPLWTSPVNPMLAVVATPFFPGWGQLYNENGWRAALAYGVQMFYFSRLLMNDRKAVRAKEYAQSLPAGPERDRFNEQVVQEYRERVRDYAWWAGGAALLIALDAYVGAHLFEFDQDPVPVPDKWHLELGPAAEAARPTGPAGLVLWQGGWTF
jgi:hypothetical protein